jgi:hypothetical protein
MSMVEEERMAGSKRYVQLSGDENEKENSEILNNIGNLPNRRVSMLGVIFRKTCEFRVISGETGETRQHWVKF